MFVSSQSVLTTTRGFAMGAIWQTAVSKNALLTFDEGERTAIMETKAEEFRRLAAEDEDRAAKARDYEAKQSWWEAARQWRDLADQAERNGW